MLLFPVQYFSIYPHGRASSCWFRSWVATARIQLSRYLYDMYTTVRYGETEIQGIANHVSLLSVVLEKLDGVLCQDEMHFKMQLQKATQEIVL